MFSPTRSCEWLDVIRCEPRAETKSGASCEKGLSQLQLMVKIEIYAIFLKCLCGDTYNDHLKVKPRAVTKRD